MGAANTPPLQPGVVKAPRPNSGGRAHPGGRPNNPASAIAAVGRVSPISKPANSLKPSSSSKHVAMLTDSDRPHTPSSAGGSQSQEQSVTQAQTQLLTDIQDSPPADAVESSPDQAAVDESSQVAAEAVTAVEPAVESAAPVMNLTQSSRRPLKLMSVVDQTMRQGMSMTHGETLNTPRHNVGQGFAKWISKAVGTTALKEKTEIEDLPAYRLRVSSLQLHPFLPLQPPPPPLNPQPAGLPSLGQLPVSAIL